MIFKREQRENAAILCQAGVKLVESVFIPLLMLKSSQKLGSRLLAISSKLNVFCHL